MVRLRCTVRGNPLPTISWLKGDKPLQLSARVRNLSNNCTIKIKETRSDDQANYTCIAENALGRINATLQLNVRQGRSQGRSGVLGIRYPGVF